MWTYCHSCQYSLKLARLGSTATLRVLAQEAHGVTHVRHAILTKTLSFVVVGFFLGQRNISDVIVLQKIL